MLKNQTGVSVIKLLITCITFSFHIAPYSPHFEPDLEG